MMDEHLDALDVGEFIEGQMESEKLAWALEHIATCGKCTELLAELALMSCENGDERVAHPDLRDILS